MEPSSAIEFGYCPYPDEQFILHGLMEHYIDTKDYEFQFKKLPFDRRIKQYDREQMDMGTISIPTYALNHRRYDLLSSGGRFGKGRGPVIVARKDLSRSDLSESSVAVPGEESTAGLLISLYTQQRQREFESHRSIVTKVEDGQYDAGVIFDDALLDSETSDLKVILDLGEWWKQETGLPVPLGATALTTKREDGPALARIIRDSVSYALQHWDQVVDECAQNDPDRGRESLDQYIRQYVNDLSLDMGSQGRRSIQTLLNRAYEVDLIDTAVNPVFIQTD